MLCGLMGDILANILNGQNEVLKILKEKCNKLITWLASNGSRLCALID